MKLKKQTNQTAGARNWALLICLQVLTTGDSLYDVPPWSCFPEHLAEWPPWLDLTAVQACILTCRHLWSAKVAQHGYADQQEEKGARICEPGGLHWPLLLHTELSRPLSPASVELFACAMQFVADGVFYAELNELLTRELAEHGYSGVEVRVTPMRTEIIIRATRTQNVLGEHQILCLALFRTLTPRKLNLSMSICSFLSTCH